MNTLSMAFKNLRNNFSFYTLYLFSVSLVITVFFAFTSFSMNKVMLEKISSDGRVESMCNTISVFLMAFVVFYMAYSNRFFLKRRTVMLTQENGIIELCVSDDGHANPDCLIIADKEKHKGIASITEQVNKMEGSITLSDNTPHGICVQIKIPMKGDVSYQYFVS